jgi:phosphatidylglycerophosphate synthase
VSHELFEKMGVQRWTLLCLVCLLLMIPIALVWNSIPEALGYSIVTALFVVMFCSAYMYFKSLRKEYRSRRGNGSLDTQAMNHCRRRVARSRIPAAD